MFKKGKDKKNSEPQATCSFCLKTKKEVKKIISGSSAFICNLCVEHCSKMLQKDKYNAHLDFKDFLKPKDIFNKLNRYVIGQYQSKQALSVAVYNHYKRVFLEPKFDVEISKSNILLLGPTGSGKTLLVQTLARILNVPCAIADATTLTESGYVGDDVENIIKRLLENSNNDLEKCERGIIYVDEIDKISRKSESSSITRDVSGEGVQQALLKIIEGDVVNLSTKGKRKHPEGDYKQINTKDILFICGGAFNGIESFVSRRLSKVEIGFGAKLLGSVKRYNAIIDKVMPNDLIRFGIIPELIGRLPVISVLKELQKSELVSILTKPKNALISQYAALFAIEGIKLEFTEGAINKIVDKAISRETGARGLRSIIEEFLLQIMFSAPSLEGINRVLIDEDVIIKDYQPLLFSDKEKEPYRLLPDGI